MRKHFRWWRLRRAVWAAVVGLVIVLGTVATGITQLATMPHNSRVSFECESPRFFGSFVSSPCATHLLLINDATASGVRDPADTFDADVHCDDIAAFHGTVIPLSDRVRTRVESGAFAAIFSFRVGAPFRCFGGESIRPFHPGTTIHEAVHRTALPAYATARYANIPYRPLPGLAYSWAFWATLAYIALTGVSFARVHGRLRKSKCPRCAYVLAGLARCPECGTVVRGDAEDAKQPAG